MREDGSLQWDLASSHGPVCVWRVGKVITTWESIATAPGCLGLRHCTLRLPGPDAKQFEAMIRKLTGVVACDLSPKGGTVVVRFDEKKTDVSSLVRMLDATRRSPERPPHDASRSHVAGFGLANTAIGLAIAGETVMPAFLPSFHAVLLVGSNLTTFGAAWRELRQGRLGLSAPTRASWPRRSPPVSTSRQPP